MGISVCISVHVTVNVRVFESGSMYYSVDKRVRFIIYMEAYISVRIYIYIYIYTSTAKIY